MSSPRLPQQGSVLLSVIALTGVISVVAVALVTMTLTAFRVTQSYQTSIDLVSVADSSLELHVNDLRRNEAAGASGEPCPDAENLGPGHTVAYKVDNVVEFPDGSEFDVVINCAGSSDPSSRTITLEAFPYSDPDGNDVNMPDVAAKPRGVARIQIIDVVGGEQRTGSRVRVCDWQLGDGVKESIASC